MLLLISDSYCLYYLLTVANNTDAQENNIANEALDDIIVNVMIRLEVTRKDLMGIPSLII